MSVAESMVIFGPMLQVGCASACSGVARASSSSDAVRNGPPEPVRRSSSTAASPPPLPAARHWNSALCSLSTGITRAPEARAAATTKGPPATMLSLFARASVAPHSSAASVARRPAAPTMPLRTVSEAPSARACLGGVVDELGDAGVAGVDAQRVAGRSGEPDVGAGGGFVRRAGLVQRHEPCSGGRRLLEHERGVRRAPPGPRGARAARTAAPRSPGGRSSPSSRG